MAQCPVVDRMASDRADDREPEARKRDSRRGEMRDTAGQRRRGRDDTDDGVHDRRIPGDAKVAAHAPADEQVAGKAQAARDGEQITAERGAVDPQITGAGDQHADDRKRAPRQHLARNPFSQQAFAERRDDHGMQRHKEDAGRHGRVLQ